MHNVGHLLVDEPEDESRNEIRLTRIFVFLFRGGPKLLISIEGSGQIKFSSWGFLRAVNDEEFNEAGELKRTKPRLSWNQEVVRSQRLQYIPDWQERAREGEFLDFFCECSKCLYGRHALPRVR